MTVELVVAWADALSPTVTVLTGTWRALKLRAFTITCVSNRLESDHEMPFPQYCQCIFRHSKLSPSAQVIAFYFNSSSLFHQLILFIFSFLFFYFILTLCSCHISAPPLIKLSHITQIHSFKHKTKRALTFYLPLIVPPLPPSDCEKIHPHVLGAQSAYWHKQRHTTPCDACFANLDDAIGKYEWSFLLFSYHHHHAYY